MKTVIPDDQPEQSAESEKLPPCGHPDGYMHDCGYVEARNKLIPRAEKLARAVAGPEPEGSFRRDLAHLQWADLWSQAFHTAMTRLWRERQMGRAA